MVTMVDDTGHAHETCWLKHRTQNTDTKVEKRNMDMDTMADNTEYGHHGQ